MYFNLGWLRLGLTKWFSSWIGPLTLRPFSCCDLPAQGISQDKSKDMKKTSINSQRELMTCKNLHTDVYSHHYCLALFFRNILMTPYHLSCVVFLFTTVKVCQFDVLPILFSFNTDIAVPISALNAIFTWFFY